MFDPITDIPQLGRISLSPHLRLSLNKLQIHITIWQWIEAD